MLTRGDITAILDDSLDRVFYSEDDFQHALAWEIDQRLPDVEVRLEREHVETERGKEYVDICVVKGDTIAPIELKYKTAGATVEIDGREHTLKNQGAHPGGRKRFINDLQRIENFIQSRNCHGFALFLTNDAQYWSKSSQEDVLDSEFRLYDGRNFTGSLEWRDERDWMSAPLLRSIDLDTKYEVNWTTYSYSPAPENGENSEFRYLLLRAE
jgi:hypothetical protein